MKLNQFVTVSILVLLLAASIRMAQRAELATRTASPPTILRPHSVAVPYVPLPSTVSYGAPPSAPIQPVSPSEEPSTPTIDQSTAPTDASPASSDQSAVREDTSSESADQSSLSDEASPAEDASINESEGESAAVDNESAPPEEASPSVNDISNNVLQQVMPYVLAPYMDSGEEEQSAPAPPSVSPSEEPPLYIPVPSTGAPSITTPNAPPPSIGRPFMTYPSMGSPSISSAPLTSRYGLAAGY